MDKTRGYGSAMKRLKVEVEGQDAVNFDYKAKLDVISVYTATLPEEILEKIFFNLEDSKDLEAVSNATPQFRRIVKPSISVWAFDQIFPLIFSKLDKKDILNCRLVCKKWKSSVDSYVQNHPQNRGLMPYSRHLTNNQTRAFDDRNFRRNYPNHRPEFRSNLCSKDLFGNTFLTTGQIEEISEEMQTVTSNPFVTRSVIFSNAYGDEETYWAYALSFLQEYGKYIWHVVVGPERPCALFNYQVLHNALRFMPNIRTLAVYGFMGGHRNVENRLQGYIQQHPLPSLAHLHTIDGMLLESNVGKLVEDEMLRRYSGQLGSLITNFRRGTPSHWNALTQMTALNVYFNSLHSWGRLCHSSALPHLQKLRLTVTILPSEPVSISKLLKPLQNAFPSLVYLHIWFTGCSRIGKCSRPPKFLLDNVKTLEINDHPDLQFDRILSFFPALEYVLVCHRPEVPIHFNVDDEREMEIRLLMRNRSMYKSDVWTRIQTLKEFTLARYGDTGDYTRNEVIVERQFTKHGYDWYVGDKL